MSAFDNKRTKNKKSYFAIANIEDASIDTTKNTKEPKKAGRGKQRQNTAVKSKGERGRPKLERKGKEVVSLFITKEQKEELRYRAEKANLPMSTYIMIKIFGLDI